ncbi:MAG: 2-succinyl-6-hydroxy-2,4-cyclohexadiene-1-carboxylate synthase [Paenisporosarcina sp.]
MKKLTANVRGLHISYIIKNPKANQTVVFLHGFTGSTKTWNEVIEQLSSDIRIVAVDLIGHGKSSTKLPIERYRIEEQVEDLKSLFDYLHLSTFTLIGYSMGGRVALAYACTYPDQLSKLLLESASPGIDDRHDRMLRIEADERLATKIENEGLVDFVDFWEQIPLFQSQKLLPDKTKMAIRSERLDQNPMGLAYSLRGIGTGQQPSYWSHLPDLPIPVVCITGEYDKKFKMIAENMTSLLKYGQHIEVLGVGHAIHVENPVQFATIIMEHVIDEI